MRTVDINSLPKLNFAHAYSVDSYFTIFTPTESCIEITYITEGELKINYDGMAVYLAKKGDVVCLIHANKAIIFTDVPHSHHTVAAAVDWQPLEQDMKGLILPIVTPSEADTSQIRKIIDDIIHNQEAYMSVSVKGSAKFLELLCAIDKCNRRSDEFDIPGTNMYIQRIKEYIQHNIHEPITQRSIAEYLGISSGYLCSIFKSSEGITLMKYINKTKLENLKLLMEIENLHLYEAAPLFGYSDPNYVSRLFKQTFGYNITDRPYTYPGKVK